MLRLIKVLLRFWPALVEVDHEISCSSLLLQAHTNIFWFFTPP